MLACAEIVDENAEIVIKPENQHLPGQSLDLEVEKEYKAVFGQIYLSKPTHIEGDGESAVIFPKEARLRNLT